MCYTTSNTANILACRTFGYLGSQIAVLICNGPLNSLDPTMLSYPLPSVGVNEPLL